MNARRSSAGSLFSGGTATATLLLLGTTTVLLGHQVHAATPVHGGVVGVPSPDVGSEHDGDMHIGNYMSTTGVDQERKDEQHAEINMSVEPGREQEQDKEHHSPIGANVLRSASTVISNTIGNLANRGPSAVSNTIGNLANRFRRKRKAGEAGLVFGGPDVVDGQQEQKVAENSASATGEPRSSSTTSAPTSPDRESQSAPSPVADPEYHPRVVGDLLDDDLPDADQEKSMMKDQDADVVLDAADVVLHAGDVLEGPLADHRPDSQEEAPVVAARTPTHSPVEDEQMTEQTSPLDDDEVERRVKRQRTDEGVFATTASAAPASPSPSSSSSASGPPAAAFSTEEEKKVDEAVRILVEKNFSPAQIAKLIVHKAVLMADNIATASDVEIEVNSLTSAAAGPHVVDADVPVVEHGEQLPATEIIPEVEQDTPLVTTSPAGEVQDAPPAATHGTTTEESMEVEMVDREEHQEPAHLEQVDMEGKQNAQDQATLEQAEVVEKTTVPGTSLVPDEHQEVAAAASSGSTGQVSSEEVEQQTGGSFFAPVRSSTQRAGKRWGPFSSWF
ncbi:unnamed protein product [Amoebophrya sp. A120]|nr:unnamed protein product [Amoebophrya sp. A120]|eukprot:GSA120T00019666001.1